MKYVERRLRRKHASTQKQYDLLSEKESVLRKALVQETDPNRIFQYKNNLEEAKQELNNLDKELYGLEQRLDELKHTATKYTIISVEQLNHIETLLQQVFWNSGVLMTAYHTSAPPDWIIPRGQDERAMLQSMLHQLAQAPRQTDGIFPILAFVEYLAAQDPESQNGLRAWVDATGSDLSLTAEDIKHLREQVQYRDSNYSSQVSHLLVQLRPQETDAHTFLVRAWLALDHTGNGNYNDIKPVEFDDSQEFFCTLEGLSTILDTLVSNSHNFIWNTETDLFIYFFVPRELLNHAIEHCEIRDAFDIPIRIGTKYTVVIRSFERLSPRYIIRIWNDWKQSWDRLIKLPEKTMETIWFCDQEKSEHTSLRARLIRKKIACLVLTFAPTLSPDRRDVFAAILGVGTPVALWPRQCIMEPAHIQEEFKTLVRLEHMYRLPKLVQDKRSEADGAVQAHFGQHLTLLWEDPYLLPPDVFPESRLQPPDRERK